MSKLSPTTQAVLDAFRSSHTGQGCLAAALRVAADQIVPFEPLKGSDPEAWQRDEIRNQILNIADGLEAQ